MAAKLELDPIREKYLAADSFFMWGKEFFDKGDYGIARVCLRISKDLFNDLSQYKKCREFVEEIEPLYKESCERLGVSP